MPGYIRRRGFRPRRKGIPPILVPLFVALALSIGFFCLVSSELRPMIETAATSRATNLIATLISGAVDECLSAEELEYSDLVSVNMDGSGNVASLTVNTAGSNRFKSRVVQMIAQQLEQVSSDDLAIPIGTLSGSILLSGLGPEIHVVVYSVGDVTVTYNNMFTAAGVNQTRHGVYLDVTATIYLLIPGEIVPVTVADSVCVAETIILGTVPDTYIHLEKGES